MHPRLERLVYHLGRLGRLVGTAYRSGLLGDLGPDVLPILRRAVRERAIGPHLIYPYQAVHRPDRVAVVDGERQLTYRQLNENMNRTASGLREIGVKPGDTAVLMVTNCAEYIEVVGGLQKMGVSVVPISTQLKAREAGYIIENAGATAVICSASTREVVAEVVAQNPRLSRRRCVVIGGTSADMVGYDEVQALGLPEEVMVDLKRVRASLLLYTSGTTGRPKGAERSLQEVGVEVALQYVGRHGLLVGDVHYTVCPLYHAAPSAFSMLLMALGGTLVIADRFDAELMLRDIERHKVSTTQLVPTQFNRLVNLPEATVRKYDLSTLRVMVSTAAYLPPPLKRTIMERFGPVLYELYGATEIGIVTVANPQDLLRNPATVGRLIPGVEVKLLDDAGDPVPVGEPGELYARTSMVISGYRNNRSATQKASRSGYFSVGDVARVDKDGYFYILDRKSDMVISGGVNIYPAEIEEVLIEHPAVFEAAVIGVPDEEWGEALKAIVVLKESRSADAEELIAWCAQRLARLKKPRTVEFVAELPRNAQGKVLKRQLRERFASSRMESV